MILEEDEHYHYHYLVGIVSYIIGAENATHFTCTYNQTARVTLLSPYTYWISSILKGELCINGGPITPPVTRSTITTTQKTTTTKKPTTESISTTIEYVTTTTTGSPSTTEEDDDEPDGTKDWIFPNSRKTTDPDGSSDSHTDARTVTSPNEHQTESISRNLLLIIAVIILLIFALVMILIIVKNRY